jgi:hypothetical protein
MRLRQIDGSNVGEGPHKYLSYGWAAILLSVPLYWYASWTTLVNALVLTGAHYDTLLWCPLIATAVTLVTAAAAGRHVVASYARFSILSKKETAVHRPILQLAGVLGLAAAGAAAVQMTRSIPVLLGMTAAVSWLAAQISSYLASPDITAAQRTLWRDLLLILLLLIALYYFGTWPDWDDSNYINLATGAQSTRGAVFQYDTMLGDGPGPIHLPTYKLHSFELLGAVLSSITGLTPIAILHLIMPVPELIFFGLTLALVLLPVSGQHWPAAALFALAFLYVDTETLGSWGLHGILRFNQGKGLLVTALAPLVVGLTVRWFVRNQKIDLIGLALSHIVAIGLSANGLYITPAASGLVAVAFLAADWKREWKQALWLTPTLAYPLIIGCLVVAFHLALPSEVTASTDPYEQLRFVIGWRAAGLVALTLLPLIPIVFAARRTQLAAMIYLPLSIALLLNPLGWKVASALTGNLGFRLIWAIPAALATGLVCVALVRVVIMGEKARWPLLMGLGALMVGVTYNARAVAPPLRARWERPGLKVVPSDYANAREIAILAPPGCTVLVPERVAVWLATIPGAPHPAFVRSLYLRHYRFTMPSEELAMRWNLLAMEAGRPAIVPQRDALAAHGIRLGLIAFNGRSPANSTAARLAKSLGFNSLPWPRENMVVWRGTCVAAREREGK